MPDTLKACVAAHTDADPAGISLDVIASGKFNRSFYVSGAGRDLVLRVAPKDDVIQLFYEKHMMRQEPELHALLLSRTDIPVPEIVAFDDSRTLLDSDFMLMERLPGIPTSELKEFDQERVLHDVGECLAEAHAITREQYGYLGAHAPMQPQDTWQAAFRDMWERLLDDIVSVGVYDDDEADGMRKLLDRHIDFFGKDIPASLLHMDVWAQNILVDGGSEISGLLDWDRALWGDPEMEFAVLDYCNISQEPFWAGYGKERDTSRAAHIRHAFYLLYEIQKYIVIRAGRQNDRSGAEEYKAQSMTLVQQSGLGD